MRARSSPARRQAAFAAATALLLPALAGCFEYEENISLSDDLSGTVWIDISWSNGWESDYPQVREFTRFLDRDEVEKDLPDGVALEAHERVQRFDRTYVRMRLGFDDLAKLREIQAHREDPRRLGETFRDLQITTLGDGTRVVSRTILPISQFPSWSESDRSDLGRLQTGIARFGADCSFRVTTPALPLTPHEPGLTDPDLRVGRTSTWRVPISYLIFGEQPVLIKVSFPPPVPDEAEAGAESDHERPSMTGYVIAAILIILVVAGGAFAATRFLLGPGVREDAGEPDAGESDGLP